MAYKTAFAVAVAAVVAITVAMVYYANKPGTTYECTTSGPCADLWYDSVGKPLSPEQECSPARKIVNPVGPGKCTNPCPAGQNACWMGDHGQCLTTACPVCTTDADCGGGENKCVPSAAGKPSYCECASPWQGSHCQNRGCSSGGCGPHGTCGPDGVTCICNKGWATPPNGDPCSVCADDIANDNAWGPPGSCIYRRYAPSRTSGGSYGAILPLPTGDCNNVTLTANSTLNQLCKNSFGPSVIYPPAVAGDYPPNSQWWCSDANGNNSCYQPGICGTIFDAGSNQILCWAPRGYYAPENTPPGNYSACNIAYGCTTAAPPGFISAAAAPAESQ